MNGQKRFNEYFAKAILEYYYNDKYSNLVIADKPDLRDIQHGIGIEVAYSMEQDRMESLFLRSQINLVDESKKVKLQNKLDKIHKKHNNENYEYEYFGDFSKGIENTYLKEIFDCVKSKVEKLNKNCNYDKLDSYELFINSAVPIKEFREEFEVLDKLIEIDVGDCKYSIIHILAQYDLISFDILNKITQRHKLYFAYSRLAHAAKEINSSLK